MDLIEQRKAAGRKGGLAMMTKYGAERMKELASRGGAATREAHGEDFYKRLGVLGAAKKQANVEARAAARAWLSAADMLAARLAAGAGPEATAALRALETAMRRKAGGAL